VGAGKGLGDTGVVGWLLPNKNTRLAPRPKRGGEGGGILRLNQSMVCRKCGYVKKWFP
jgi:hypothetical protein